MAINLQLYWPEGRGGARLEEVLLLTLLPWQGSTAAGRRGWRLLLLLPWGERTRGRRGRLTTGRRGRWGHHTHRRRHHTCKARKAINLTLGTIPQPLTLSPK